METTTDDLHEDFVRFTLILVTSSEHNSALFECNGISLLG